MIDAVKHFRLVQIMAKSVKKAYPLGSRLNRIQLPRMKVKNIGCLFA